MKKIYLIMLLLLAYGVSNATVRYVDSAATGANNGSSWINAYKYLSTAISVANAAATSDTIYIAKGTYYPTGAKAGTNRDSTLLIKRGGLKFYGGYPTGGGTRNITANLTVVSGDINTAGTITDNSYHVMLITGLATTADSVVVDGITVTAGNADGSGSFTYGTSITPQNNGAGMYTSLNNSNTKIAVRNCNFLRNTSSGGGGGGMCNDASSPGISNCTFSGNTAIGGGGVCNQSSSPSISNCTFSGNAASYGAGIYNITSSPSITSCTFSADTASYGGGVYNYTSSPSVTSCIFLGNTAAYYGGGMYNYYISSPSISNCTFSGNTASSGVGGGMFNHSSSPSITGCNFSGNTASAFGGGMLNFDSWSSISNCNFSGNSALNGGGMCNQSASPSITGCNFSGNTATNGGGMCNFYSSSPRITNCSFLGNTASGMQTGGGVDNNYNDSTTTFTNCSFYNNTATASGSAGGLMSSGYSSLAITNIANSIFWGNTGNTTALGGVGTYGSGTNNTTYSDVQGIAATGTNINANPLFMNAAGGNLQLQLCSPAINAGSNAAIAGYTTDLAGASRIFNTTVDMGAYECTVSSISLPVVMHVDSTNGNDANNGGSWSTAYKTLSYALNRAQLCDITDSILVAKGTYYPTGVQTGTNRDSTFLITRGGLKIYGGYPAGGGVRNITANATKLSGAINTSSATDNSYHVMVIAGIGTTADSIVVDGVTLTNGYATGSGSKTYNGLSVSRAVGGGIFILRDSIAKKTAIRNCTLYACTASYGGGAQLEYASPYIFKTTFDSDSAGGGGGINISPVAAGYGNPIIDSCTFTNNNSSSSGGGMRNEATALPTVTNCTFSSNTAYNGGGMYSISCSAIVTNCSFLNNTATSTDFNYGGGGMFNQSSSPTVSNCTFSGNSTSGSGGGGIYNKSSSSPTLMNCIFSSNTAYNGGGVLNYSSSPSIINCTFSGNTAPGSGGGTGGGGAILNFASSSPAVTNCIFSGNTAGGNGGAVLNYTNSSPTVRNTTFSGNKAGGTGGIFNQDASSPTISNTIIFGNSSGVGSDASSSSTITYSLVQGITTGIGNINGNTDPLFVSPQPVSAAPTTAGNYRLQSCSPAINVGRNDSIPTGITIDLVGNARIYNTTVDLGAYEFQSSPTLRYYDTLRTAICSGDSLRFNGIYYKAVVTHTDSFRTVAGCDSFKTLQLSINPRATTPTVTTPIAYCLGATATALTATKGSASDTLLWYTALTGGTGSKTAPTPLTTPTGSTTYYVSGKNNLGCEGARTALTVNVNPLATTPTVTSPIAYCLGATATALTATAGGSTDTLLWYTTPSGGAGSKTAPTPLTTPTGSTTYYVSGKTSLGCEGARTPLVVNINPLPTIGGTLSVCVGQTSGLTGSASPDATTPWTSSNTSIATVSSTGVVTGVSAGTTTITYKNTNGCTQTATFTVNPLPSISGTLSACVGQTSTLTSSATADATTPWTSSNTAVATITSAGVVTGVSAGTSTITYKNTNGCTITTTFTVNALPTISGTLVACVGQTSTLTGSGTPFATTPWTSSNTAVATVSSTGVVTGVSGGTSTITYKNSNGCTISATFTVNALPTISGTLSACAGQSTTLTGSASPDATTPWTSSNTTVATITSAGVVSALSAGTTTITYKNSNGCVITATFTTNPLPLAPTVVSPLNLCHKSVAGPLTATGTSLLWYTVPSGGMGTATAPFPSTATLGTTPYYVSQTTALGCEGPRATLNVVLQPLPVVTLSSLAPSGLFFCKGKTILLKATSLTATAYQWSFAGTNIVGATKDTIAAGTTGYWTASVTDIYGCKNQDSVRIRQDTSVTSILSPTEVTICTEGNTLLTCNPGYSSYSFNWYKDGLSLTSTSAISNTATATSSGIYKVVVTNYFGCIDTTNTSVVSYYPKSIKPTIINSNPWLECSGSYIYYQWYKNGVSIFGATSKKYKVSSKGLYHVEITDQYGCLYYSDTVNIVPTSINGANISKSEIKLYPNPTQNIVNVETPIKVNIRVTDMAGKLILETKEATKIDLEPYAAGVYLLTITDTEGNYIGTEKIQKLSE